MKKIVARYLFFSEVVRAFYAIKGGISVVTTIEARLLSIIQPTKEYGDLID